ncbi:hypothetical protein B296_00045312 [Ensete ventricosum]|uniref:Uncharacterized protein n=1 Tax=Ensete ventricosum TaxID=4639 RepID=A0A426YN81_ENSVE|nr:hypothetical protein B296_00045312 [Ensete ventricosum]
MKMTSRFRCSTECCQVLIGRVCDSKKEAIVMLLCTAEAKGSSGNLMLLCAVEVEGSSGNLSLLCVVGAKGSSNNPSSLSIDVNPNLGKEEPPQERMSGGGREPAGVEEKSEVTGSSRDACGYKASIESLLAVQEAVSHGGKSDAGLDRGEDALVDECQESPKEDDGAILNGGEEGVMRRLWKRASSMALWRAAIISRIAEVLERQSRRMSLMPVWPKEQEA